MNNYIPIILKIENSKEIITLKASLFKFPERRIEKIPLYNNPFIGVTRYVEGKESVENIKIQLIENSDRFENINWINEWIEEHSSFMKNSNYADIKRKMTIEIIQEDLIINNFIAEGVFIISLDFFKIQELNEKLSKIFLDKLKRKVLLEKCGNKISYLINRLRIFNR